MDKNVLKDALIDYVEDTLGIECKYDEKNSMLLSPVLQLNAEIAAKRFLLAVRLYEDGFRYEIYCVGYEPVPENMKETMTFIGMVNNVIAPGTQISYFPGRMINVQCYVDCYSDQGQRPANLKLHKNFNAALAMYGAVMDMVLAVDLGYVSAVDAFKSLMQ